MNTELRKIGKFGFCKEWPDDLMKDVLKYFQESEWLIPEWCHICVLRWDDSEGEAILRVTTDYEYRRIYITIGPQWLTISKEEKLASARHELIHGFNTIISDYAILELDRILPEDSAYKESIVDGIKLRVEQATCDLEYCLDKVKISLKKS